MAEGEDDGQEKTHEPTPRKIEQAREKGDIAKSNDLDAAAAYLGLVAAVAVMGGWSAASLGRALEPFIGSVDRLEGRLLGPGWLETSGALFGPMLWAIAPIMLAPAVMVIAALVAQQAIVFAPSKLAPKLNKISPLSQAKQKFGPKGLVEFGKSAVKMGLIGTGVWIWATQHLDMLLGMLHADPRALPQVLGGALVDLLAIVTTIAIAIGLFDLFWQRFQHMKKLMMSYEELKKESKESEGDPHMKSKRRSRAEEIALNQMMLDVPKSDVVIVNPTHYAVALKWSREKGSAPKLVAKGVDAVAARIRESAAEAGVPIHRDPPTARAIHGAVELNQEIHPDHYRAVAAAIRFAEEMRRKAKSRSW